MFYLSRSQIFLNSLISLLALLISFSLLTFGALAQSQSSSISQQEEQINSGYAPRFVGVVRRSNPLADFEAAINLLANGAEIAGLIFGLVLICHSVFFGKSQWVIPVLKLKFNRYSQFFLGVGLIIVGLAIPGIINSCVASTRCGA